MTWLVALAVVGALMASTVMFFRRKPDPSRRADASRFDRFAPLPPLELTEPDALELAELGRRVEQDFGLAPVQILLHRLGNVTRRSVPLRAVRPGPARGLARICFADGTTLQVRGRQVGDLGYLAATATAQYRIVQMVSEAMIPIGRSFCGLCASSAVVATTSKPM